MPASLCRFRQPLPLLLCYRLLVAFVLVSLTGCGGCSSQTLAPMPKGELAVRLMVLEAPDGTTMALVPVYINDTGPYTFALDTGASDSVVDLRIAEKLHLEVAGREVTTTGVAAVSKGIPVRVEKWRIGDIKMPARRMVAIKMPQSGGSYQLQGLLGSDILHEFGKIEIDYKGQLLILHPEEKKAAR